jgi:hypothetical protein
LHAVFTASASALWRDEINSIATASVPLADLSGILQFESFPPLYDLLIRGWLLLGGSASDIALRIAGSAGGLLLLATIWFATWRLGRTLPVISLALLAVNPEIIRWGASLRAWSLGAALGLVMVVLIFEAANVRTRRGMLMATLAAVLAVQTVYQNSVLLAIVLGCAAAPWLWRRDWSTVGRLAAIGAIACASMLPYWSVLRRRADWQGLTATPVASMDLLSKLWELLSASGPVASVAWCALPVAAVVFAIRSERYRRLRFYLISVAALATVGLFVFYLGFKYPTQRWYYFALAPLIAVTAEIALTLDSHSIYLRRARILVAVSILLAGTLPAFRAVQVRQTTMNVVASIVMSGAETGDLIVISPWYYGVSFTYYYRGSLQVMTIPPLGDVRVHRYDLLKNAMLDPDPMKPLREQLQRVLESGHRIWLVGGLETSEAGTVIDRPGTPPLPRTRWNSSPYEEAWSREIGQFLAAHTTPGELVPMTQFAQPFETPTVAVIRGWKQ